MKLLATLALALIPAFSWAQVTIKGTVKNNGDSMLVFRKAGFHPITRERQDKRYKAPVDKHGKFRITLPEEGVGEWLLEFDDQFQFFVLVQGHDVEVKGDFSKPEPLTAIGENAGDFNYRAYWEKEALPKFDHNKHYRNSLRSSKIDSVILARNTAAAYYQQVLDEYKSTHRMSERCYQWLKTKYRYEPYERTLVENTDRNHGVDSSVVSAIMACGTNDDFAALNCAEYNDLISMLYMHYQFNKLKFPLKVADYFDFGTGNILKGSTRDVFLTREIVVLSQAEDSIYRPLFSKYKNIVKDKHLTELVLRARNEYRERLAASKLSKENISQHTSLNEIFGKYKGKVIYVDFWASWCSPCRSEMPNAARLKKKLSGREVTFLYLGHGDKKENWLAARKELEIDGEHYLLDGKLMKEASEVFGITGIPHYAIIDKRGNIIRKSAARPQEAYEELLKLADLP